MSFDGSLLKRGFWIYIWKITARSKTFLYVGRTGDSSSVHAASPFTRIGQHLDSRQSAKGNAMARQLKRAGIDPTTASFDMIAFGPLFDEQKTIERHRLIRDDVGAIEKSIAYYLRQRGYSVLGTHQSNQPVDSQIFEQLIEQINGAFPKLDSSPT
jgi:hypothetical protein